MLLNLNLGCYLQNRTSDRFHAVDFFVPYVLRNNLIYICAFLYFDGLIGAPILKIKVSLLFRPLTLFLTTTKRVINNDTRRFGGMTDILIQHTAIELYST